MKLVTPCCQEHARASQAGSSSIGSQGKQALVSLGS
jgi:hypothetical protein